MSDDFRTFLRQGLLGPEAEARMDRDAQAWQEERDRADRVYEHDQFWFAIQARGIPRKDAQRLRTGLSDTSALAAAKQFLAAPTERILVLSGHKGCGKTVAAGWCVLQGSPDPYVPRHPEESGVRRHIDGYRQSWPTGPRFLTAAQLARVSMYSDTDLKPLYESELLAIDDLGVEYLDQKGAFLSLFDALFDARYANDARTVITTNLPAVEFKARYGERVADRIREVGRFVELADKSMRGRQ